MGQGHHKGVDYWAIGILIYEMLCGYSPFADMERNDQVPVLLCLLIPLGRSSENVHAREGLACRKRVAPASSPAAPASRVRRSRRLRSTLAAALGLLAHALVTKQ